MLLFCQRVLEQHQPPHLRCTPSMSWVIFRVTAYLARRQFRRALVRLCCRALASALPRLLLRTLLSSDPCPEPFMLTTEALLLTFRAARYSSKVSKFCRKTSQMLVHSSKASQKYVGLAQTASVSDTPAGCIQQWHLQVIQIWHRDVPPCFSHGQPISLCVSQMRDTSMQLIHPSLFPMALSELVVDWI